VEEAEHRDLGDDLLDAAAEPVEEVVGLHLEWYVGHWTPAGVSATDGSSTRRKDTAELLLRVLDGAMWAANISRVTKNPLVFEESQQLLLQGLLPDLGIMVNPQVRKRSEDNFACDAKVRRE